MSLDSLLQPPLNSALDHPTLIFGLLLSFIIGQFNAWCYMSTHRGLSYTSTFTHSIVLITMISTISMGLVSQSFLAAFGLLGGMAIIRFRTVVRDARDSCYLLLALVCGIAIGFGMFSVAIVGALAANAVAVYMARTGFGSWSAVESLLRVQIETQAARSPEFERLLQRYCRRHAAVAVDEALASEPGMPALCQCVYRVSLRNANRAAEFVSALKEKFHVEAVHLVVEQEHDEIA
jgi:uncharacterized membrane protein YhiD involved in acid resistance